MMNNACLSLKITNWCDLHCAHCCERSNSKEVPEFMPLEKVEKYLDESREMPVQFNDLLTIGGGEALSPYAHNMPDYIPKVLGAAYNHYYVPTIKTNGTWGNDDKMRGKILSDLAMCAYDANKLVTLDISVDEFHTNLRGVANIFCDTLNNPELAYAIRLCLIGFNTQKSQIALMQLKTALRTRDIGIFDKMENGDMIMWAPNDTNGVYVVADYNTPIYNRGRAADNKVYTSDANPNGDGTVDCLQLDNKDMAIYNYTYQEPIKDRPLSEIVNILSNRAKVR